jgi:Zn-dependent peptidase ImmA (M78 family)/transcriptional regulator with XRE-family HTH domain
MNALAQRLIAARKASGISQEAASTHLGMSRPTFIAIEKGTRAVKPEELVLLASLYNTSINRLMRQKTAPPAIAPHLRAAVDKADDDAGLEEAIGMLTAFVDDYQFLQEKVCSNVVPTPPVQPARFQMSLERFAEHCAHEQRKQLGFGDREPVSFLRKTLDEVGVHVFIDSLNSKLAGLYAFVEGFGYCILINRKHPPARRRWTIAHEYGHFLFDRDKPGVDYIKPMLRKPENERFADLFAAHFLMPKAGLERRFYDAYEQKGDVNVGDVLRIADYYRVSLMAMVLRLESIGLIRKGSWDEIKASGARVQDIRAESGTQEVAEKEPVEIFPERYIMLAISAWNSEEITTSQFAKLLRKPVVEARETAMKRSRLLDNDEGGNATINLSLGDSILRREHHTA